MANAVKIPDLPRTFASNCDPTPLVTRLALLLKISFDALLGLKTQSREK
jgi:hypothetical protein